MACERKDKKWSRKRTREKEKESKFKSGVHLIGRFVYRIRPNKRSFECSMQEDRKKRSNVHQTRNGLS